MPLNTVLNEICQFSAMQATTALSKFLGIPIGVDLKLVEIKKIDEINLFHPNDVAVSIFLPITGDIPGASFFIYTEESAHSLCEVLFHKMDGSLREILDPEISALSEVANIMIGNFLTHFAQSLQVDMLMHRSPIFDHAPLEEVLQKRLLTLDEKMEEAVLSITFGFKHIKIKGYVLIVFSEEKINQALMNIAAPTDM